MSSSRFFWTLANNLGSYTLQTCSRKLQRRSGWEERRASLGIGPAASDGLCPYRRSSGREMSELATTSVLVPPIGAGPETKARSPRVTILESPRGPGLYSRTRISCDSPRHSPGLSLRRPSDRPSKETNLSPDSSSPRSRSPSLQKFDPFKRSKSPVTPAAQAALASFEVAHTPELVRAQSMARSMLARKKVKETLSAQKSTYESVGIYLFCL